MNRKTLNYLCVYPIHISYTKLLTMNILNSRFLVLHHASTLVKSISQPIRPLPSLPVKKMRFSNAIIFAVIYNNIIAHRDLILKVPKASRRIRKADIANLRRISLEPSRDSLALMSSLIAIGIFAAKLKAII